MRRRALEQGRLAAPALEGGLALGGLLGEVAAHGALEAGVEEGMRRVGGLGSKPRATLCSPPAPPSNTFTPRAMQASMEW